MASNSDCFTSSVGGLDHAISGVGIGYETMTVTEQVEVPGPETCKNANNGQIKQQRCKLGETYKADTQECCVQTTTTETQTVEKQVSYWIAQNSWGTGWGDGGFLKLERTDSGSGACGVNLDMMYVDVQPLP